MSPLHLALSVPAMVQVTRPAGLGLIFAAWCLRLLLFCTGVLLACFLTAIATTEWLYSPAFTRMTQVAPFLSYTAQALAFSHAFIPEYQEFSTAVRIPWDSHPNSGERDQLLSLAKLGGPAAVLCS